MGNLIALIDAICDTYDRPDLRPLEDGTTFCNIAVAAVANALNCKGLSSMTADQIMAFISQSADWSNVPIQRVQDMANDGSLVIGGLDSKTLDSAHGHVVVVRPGVPCYSGKWGLVPRVLNVGKDNFLARAHSGPLKGMAVGVNESFIPLPEFYVWRPSLGA